MKNKKRPEWVEEIIKDFEPQLQWVILHIKPTLIITQNIWKIHIATRRLQIKQWFQQLTDFGIRLGIFFIFACILQYIFFYFSKMAWILYSQTYLGIEFLKYFPEEAQSISAFLSLPAMGLVIDISWQVCRVCIAMAAICQFFCISTYLFYRFFWIVRTVIFGGVGCYVTANYYLWYYNLPEAHILMACVLPFIVFLDLCFNSASVLLPELPDLINGLIKIVKSILKLIKTVLVKWNILPIKSTVEEEKDD